MNTEKLAIRVLTEFDRVNVIPFFEKHFKGCNKHFYRKHQVDVGEIWAIDNDGWLDWLAKHQLEETPYTILDGVPENLELPKLEPIKSREQELEETLRDLRQYTQTLSDIIDNCPCDPDITTEQINAWNKHHALVKEFGQEKIKQLLNQTK